MNSLVSARCDSCVYFWRINEGAGYKGCEYILHTGKCRPCPAGAACTVYKAKRTTAKRSLFSVPLGPYKWTPARIARGRMYIAEGMTYRQAAEKMGVSSDALWAALKRARKEEENAADIP